MDCDKFDSVLMDLLYEELDELTRAAAQRHADQCQRCRESLAAFKATREVARVPMTELPEGFESRVLEAERAARRELPVRARIVRALTILSGYAMRPQLAMAALLLLVIGTSLALLRPKPGSHGSVHVTEHGVPEADKELVVALEEVEEPKPAPVESKEPLALSDAPKDETKMEKVESSDNAHQSTEAESALDEADDRARAEAEDQAYATAMDAYRAGNHTQAQEQFDAIVQSGGRNARAAELYAAYAAEKAGGCAAALPRFDSVSAHNSSNDLGHQATWQSATCRAQVGEDARARLDFQKLLQVPAYSARARQALEQMGDERGDSSMLATRRAKAEAESSAASNAEKEGAPPASEASPRVAAGSPAKAKRAAKKKPATSKPKQARPPTTAKSKSAPPPSAVEAQ